MPELPEVETTVRALNKTVKGLRIKDVWSSYNSPFHKGKGNIKDAVYFDSFRKTVLGQEILKTERKAKNVLIDLGNNKTVLIHMKMTGHFLYGDYEKVKAENGEQWLPKEKGSALSDPMNKFIRLVFKLSNGKELAFSDMRRFAKVYAFPTKEKNSIEDLKKLGPDPLGKNFSAKIFGERILSRPNGKIKQVLMDQEIIAGIGNIYSDEILWLAGIHPFSSPSKIPKKNLGLAYKAIKKVLKKAIETGGDSMSDFRRLNGKPGGYQNFHKAYRKTGQPCSKPGCPGVITRKKLGGRSAHFCPVHQILFK